MVSQLEPDYEVKLRLKPEVWLESDGRLKDLEVSDLQMSSEGEKLSIQFVDTAAKLFYNRGWSMGIRKSERQDTLRFTYTKSYPVETGGNSSYEVSKVVQAAFNQGFDSSTRFEAHVEIGLTKQTLLMSHNKDVPNGDYDGLKLPKERGVGVLMAKNSPEFFQNWYQERTYSSIYDLLAYAKVYGPVKGTRLRGHWEDFELFIDVWPVRASKTDATLLPIVEASFKTDDLERALRGRDELVNRLRSKGWLLAEESLKTQLIMDRYGPADDSD